MGGDSLFLCTKDCFVSGIFFKLEILDRKHLESLKPVCKYFCQAVFFFPGDFLPWGMESGRAIIITAGEGKEILKVGASIFCSTSGLGNNGKLPTVRSCTLTNGAELVESFKMHDKGDSLVSQAARLSQLSREVGIQGPWSIVLRDHICH